MKPLFIFSILVLTSLGMVNAQTERADTSAIQKVLSAQQEAWNRGDIDGFMNGYAKSSSTTFVSEDEVTRGWETVRNRYRNAYSDRSQMGKLTFFDLDITSLGQDSALVTGGWRLEREKDAPHGRFTLLFRLTDAGWKIVHDHTSAAPQLQHKKGLFSN